MYISHELAAYKLCIRCVCVCCRNARSRELSSLIFLLFLGALHIRA